MTGRSGPVAGFLPLTLCAAFFILGASEAAGQAPRTFLYVDTAMGNDDTGDGSLASPFKSLNKALRKAFEIRYVEPANPCIDTDMLQQVDVDVVIKVKTPTVPISPWEHGGFEMDGWLSYKDEDCLQVTREPFPIRMVDRVSIEGVRSGGVKARVSIDDANGTAPFNWGSTVQPRRSYFHGASSATLSNLFLDGTAYFRKKSDRPNAVFAEKVHGLVISHCRIEDLYDGLYFLAEDPGNQQDPGSGDSVSCSVTDCELIGLGPIDFENPDNEAQGHAACWMIGAGNLDISFSTTRFEESHDAIEVAGNNMTDGRLSITDCTFYRNENGIEAVGSGQLVAVISDCVFDSNYNLDGGMPLFLANGTPNSPGAIAARTMQNNITVRSSTFFNNAFHFFVSTTGTYDFGESGLAGPGLNTFGFDFAPWQPPNPPAPDPLRVAMHVKNSSAIVLAGGNTWWPLNQGADANGCLTGTMVGFPAGDPNYGENNLFSAPTNPSFIGPPGPAFGYCCETGSQPWRRNYSLEPGTTIHFGSDCLP